jgi:hypothetical protein
VNDNEVYTRLAPLRRMMREHRSQTMRVTARQLSAKWGKGPTWICEMELGHFSRNPGLERLTNWAVANEAQEFGLYIVLNNVYTDIPLITPEDS